MNDQQLDALVATTAVTDTQLADMDLSAVEAELREAISARQQNAPWLPQGSRSGRRVITVAAAAAMVALAMLVVRPFSGGEPAWAAVLISAAEDSPLLLVTEPGWTVARADVYGAGIGEMTFTNATTDLDLHWRDPNLAGWVKDRANSADHREKWTVLGFDATIFRYADSNDYTTLLSDGRNTIEIRGQFASLDDYKTTVSSVARVDVDTWLSAMPPRVIASADRAAAVREILADIPVPDSVDAAALEAGRLRDRYQLGAEVTGAVACGWIQQWLGARESGDTRAADQAAAAMSTATGWSILQEMNAEGDWPEVMWEFAAAMHVGEQMPYDHTVAATYRSSLGCGEGL